MAKKKESEYTEKTEKKEEKPDNENDEEEGTRLDCLKEEYKELQKKYGLPDFKEMNENFQIEKIDPTETEHLVREMRKFIGERTSSYLKFLETLLQPMNVPNFVYSIVKCLNNEDKEKLKEVYEKLSKIEIEIVYVDTEYSEEREAEFIKNSNSIWNEVKGEVREIMEKVRNDYNLDKKSEKNNDYFR